MKKNIAFVFGLMFLASAPFNVFAEVGIDSAVDWGTPTENVSPSGQLYSNTTSDTGSGLSGGTANVSLLVAFLQDALTIATGLILAAAVVFFLWGVSQFVRAAGDEEARKTGKNHIIYGIIGIAVMVSMWGLVNFLTKSANLTLSTGSVPALPEMPK